jgi:hypothetical protein
MPDENYALDITYSGGTFTFPIMVEFFPKLSFNWKRSGHEVAVIDRVPVRGWFAEADQDTNISRWNTLKSIAQNGAFTVMTMRKASGTVVYSYAKAQIQNLEMVNYPGGYVNHVEFTFEITEERGVTYPNLVDVGREDEEIEEVDEKGVTVKRLIRTVRAVGAFGNLSAARSFVEGLKPSKENLRRFSIREISYDGEVIGTWEYDDTKEKTANGVRRWKERCYWQPGQRTHKFYPVAVGFTPILLRGGYMESRLDVSGEAEIYADTATSLTDMVDRIKGQVPAATDVVLENPSFGSLIPVDFDVETAAPTVFGMSYSYTLAFGTAGEPPLHIPIDLKNETFNQNPQL